MTASLLAAPDWETRTLSVESRDGTKLFVTDTGTGRPIVLIHGVALTHEVWLPQIRALRDRYRVVAYDVRGHGDSDEGVEGYSPKLFADDLAGVLTSLDLRNAVLVGHSLGGTNIGQFVVDHSAVVDERVSGLIFMSTFGAALKGEGFWRERFGSVQTRALASWLRRRNARTTNHDGRLVRALTRRSFGPDPADEDVRRLIEIGSCTKPSVTAACAVGNLTYDVVENLAEVTVPSLVVVGAKDRTAPVRSSRRIATALPNAELVVLPGAGHPLGLQRPADVSAIIDRFCGVP